MYYYNVRYVEWMSRSRVCGLMQFNQPGKSDEYLKDCAIAYARELQSNPACEAVRVNQVLPGTSVETEIWPGKDNG